jgi:pimeloyl-ACP methyl ester carboxylesterase
MSKKIDILRFSVKRENDDNLVVRGRISIPLLSEKKVPLLIIVPGFLGFKDWGFYPHLSEKLIENNYSTILFNHSTGGVDESGRPYSDLKNLKRTTIGNDLIDLKSIYNFIRHNEKLNGRIDFKKIGLIGHSKGGGVAIIHSRSNPNVRAIVTINGIERFQRIPKEKVDSIIKQGYHEILLQGMLQKFRFEKDFWEDIETNKSKYDIISTLRKIDARCLFVQGDEDDKVDISEAKAMHSAIPDRSDLMIIESADHNFGCNVFCERLPALAESIFDKVIEWLDKVFKQGEN